jgi:sugar (pentulose or hexulose) kinase
MDPKARAGFIGLTLRHGPAHFVRALLEGVAFALRQIVGKADPRVYFTAPKVNPRTNCF